MTQTTQRTGQGADQGIYPIDNQTYDLMQALVSKCEAIEAYRKYADDGDERSRKLFEDLMRDERQHADRILGALKESLQRQ